MTGDQILLDAAIPTTATQYTAGDSIGGLIVQTPGTRRGNGRIVDVKMVDTLNRKPALTLLFFSDNPASSTISDNSAFVLAAADVDKLVGVLGVAAADWVTVDSKGILNVAAQVDVRWVVPTTNNGLAGAWVPKLYMVVVSGGTPTYGADSVSLYVKLGLDTVVNK